MAYKPGKIDRRAPIGAKCLWRAARTAKKAAADPPPC